MTLTPEAARLRASAPGVWEVDGERFVVEPSPEGGLMARDSSGAEVGAAWVISRGRKVSSTPAPPSE